MEEDIKKLEIDPALAPVGEIFRALISLEPYLPEDSEKFFSLEKIRLQTPVEIDVYVSEQGQVKLAGSPPVYSVRTTDMPVLHKLELTITSVSL